MICVDQRIKNILTKTLTKNGLWRLIATIAAEGKTFFLHLIAIIHVPKILAT